VSIPRKHRGGWRLPSPARVRVRFRIGVREGRRGGREEEEVIYHYYYCYYYYYYYYNHSHPGVVSAPGRTQHSLPIPPKWRYRIGWISLVVVVV